MNFHGECKGKDLLEAIQAAADAQGKLDKVITELSGDLLDKVESDFVQQINDAIVSCQESRQNATEERRKGQLEGMIHGYRVSREKLYTIMEKMRNNKEVISGKAI